jgi:hypothetical protein
MADATVDILLRLQSDVAGIKRASSALDGFVNQFKTGFNLNLGGNLASFIVSLPLKLVALGKAAVDTADQIKDMTDNLEISIQGYETLSDLVKRTGGDLSALNTALSKQRASLADAWREGGRARDAYQTLGLSMSRMRQLAPERQFEAIAVAIANAADREEAFAAAGDILGEKSIPKLRAALKELAEDGYDKVRDSAAGASRFMRPETVARLEALKQSLGDVKDQLLAKVGNDLASVLSFVGQEVDTPAAAPQKTGAQIQAERERERLINQSALATFTLTNAQQALAEIEADSTRTEIQKRPQIIALLRAQADEIDRIREGKFQDVVSLKDGTIPTDEQLKRLAEANRLQAEANALREKANLLKTGGPSAFQELSDRAQGVNDPSQNSSFLTATEGMEAGFLQFQVQVGSIGQQIATTLNSTLGGAISNVSQGIYGLITRTATWGDLFRSVGASIVQSLIQLGVQMAVNFALGEVFKKKATQSSVQSGAQIAASNAPAAAATSVASYGSAAIIGTIAAIAGIALIIGLLSKGFADGGFTAPGGRNQVAGIVHAGEWVAPQWMVNSPSFGATIASLERGRRGYADGGLVGGGASSFTGAGSGSPMQIVLVDSRREASRLAKNSDAETQIVDIVRNNRYSIFGA